MTNTTLKKISEVLGLSISTISRALKNHPDISEKTKKKVPRKSLTKDDHALAREKELNTEAWGEVWNEKSKEEI